MGPELGGARVRPALEGATLLGCAACTLGASTTTKQDVLGAAGMAGTAPNTGAQAGTGASSSSQDAAQAEPASDGGVPAAMSDASGGDAGAGGAGNNASQDAAVSGSDAAVQPGAYQTLTVDGNAVSVYLPARSESASPAPVVFSLHGLSIPAMAMADITGLPAIADKEGFIAVFPAGAGGTWNTGGSGCGLGATWRSSQRPRPRTRSWCVRARSHWSRPKKRSRASSAASATTRCSRRWLISPSLPRACTARSA